MMDNYFGGDQTAMAKSAYPLGNLTLKSRLEHAVRDAEERLKDAKEAKEIFDRNPDLEKLLNIMQKGRF